MTCLFLDAEYDTSVETRLSFYYKRYKSPGRPFLRLGDIFVLLNLFLSRTDSSWRSQKKKKKVEMHVDVREK